MVEKNKKQPDINDEYKLRLAKLKHLSGQVETYPSISHRDLSIASFLEQFADLLKKGKEIVLAGRIVSMRRQGGSCFLHFVDYSGRLQAFLRKENLGAEVYQAFADIDEGDIVEFKGKAFLTKTKEKTILVSDFTLLAKALLPLPDQYYGLKDPDLRYRKRYLDLLVNQRARQIFDLRSRLVKSVRNFFDNQGFIEVETPILQSIAGGAAAKPFVTKHHALDLNMYLRVAPELYLKRLIIGGYEKVFEIGRCFRNEGIDHQHNPEFTQVEAYWAYQDYWAMMKLVESLLSHLVKENFGKFEVKNGNDLLNFKTPYPRLDFREALLKATKLDIDLVSDKDLFAYAKQAGLKTDKTWGRGKVLDELYKKFVRKQIIQPTFIIHHPLELSPLAKRLKDRPNYVERFQLVVKGAEICNAFSELNDPEDQEKRFKEQKKLQVAGDSEAFAADADFVEALKYGLAPTTGLGLGIDRLVMILGDIDNVKEVILFPTMRPKNE